MPLEHKDIKDMSEKAYVSGQTNREESSDDTVFYWITHFSGDLFEGSNLPYKGEFDVIRKAGRRVIADLKENDVQAEFDEIGEVAEGTKDFLSGKYLASQHENTSIEAFNNADQDIVVCGHGAWEMYTEYENLVSDNRNQVIKRRPIPEANNVLFWDPNAMLKDKSDADYGVILRPYSPDGYKKMVNELTGEDIEEINPSQFMAPENSYTFPWISGRGEKIYVGRFYHREKTKIKYITFEAPFGETRVLEESKIEEIMDELASSGFEIVSEKTIESYKVTLYIVSGEKIIKSYEIAGPNIPIVSEYGERTIIEGEEHYEGITRLAKGPQILRDFILSYLTDIVSRSPREKPVWAQEQIAGLEDFYETQGADDNFPYAIQNLYDANGKELPLGPLGMVPGHEPPQAIGALIQLTRQAIEDVADSGLPENIAEVDLSGVALQRLEARLDMQSMTFQENRKHARRRDAEIFAGMGAVIFDTPRTERIQLPDGTKKTVTILEQVVDQETGDIVTINDMRNTMWEVSISTGPSYKSQKDKTLDILQTMLQNTDPQDPMKRIIQLKIVQLSDGVEYEDMRDYARKELIMMGIQDPETDEEKQLVQQQAEMGQQPDAAMVLAMAEDKKAQADLAKVQLEFMKLRIDAQKNDADQKIDGFNAMTKRMEALIKVQESKAKINTQRIDNFGKQLDNSVKISDRLRGRIEQTA